MICYVASKIDLAIDEGNNHFIDIPALLHTNSLATIFFISKDDKAFATVLFVFYVCIVVLTHHYANTAHLLYIPKTNILILLSLICTPKDKLPSNDIYEV